MPGLFASTYLPSILGFGAFLIVWFIVFRMAHLLTMLVRHGPLIGWAVGPLGVTVLFLHEPSVLFIWLDVLFPALISGSTIYVGLFTSLSPLPLLSHHLVLEIMIIAAGVLITSSGDFIKALRDVRHPLWGEARVLRSIQVLQASWARIHFTPFGSSYLRDHFASNPADLLRLLQG